MGGPRINKAKLALMVFLKSLPEDSYFNVVSFGTTYKFLFQESVKNESVIMKDALKKIG